MNNQIEEDLKKAMLAGDRQKIETLRGLKNALQYEAVNLGVKDKGLNDQQAMKVLARESKKRTEAAEIYENGGERQRASAERAEQAIIDAYLPKRLEEDAVRAVVKEQIGELGAVGPADAGRVIGSAVTKLAGRADGAVVARIARELLGQV